MSALVIGSEMSIKRRLAPVSLELEAGEVVALIGPNGSGKTSLLDALAGIPPSDGAVTIGGDNPARMNPDLRQGYLTYLPASRDIAWPISARDFIALALPAATDWSGFAGLLELEPLLDRRMDQLSTGERTRVMITRALAPQPHLLLLDEPTANLDPFWQKLILQELQRRAHDGGSAVLLAIHDLRAAVECTDRLLLMDGGQVRADCRPNEMVQSGLLETVFRLDARELLHAPMLPEGRRSSP